MHDLSHWARVSCGLSRVWHHSDCTTSIFRVVAKSATVRPSTRNTFFGARRPPWAALHNFAPGLCQAAMSAPSCAIRTPQGLLGQRRGPGVLHRSRRAVQHASRASSVRHRQGASLSPGRVRVPGQLRWTAFHPQTQIGGAQRGVRRSDELHRHTVRCRSIGVGSSS